MACNRGRVRHTKPIGSGAYLIHDWVPNQQLVLRASPGYIGGKPAFKEIVIKPVPEAACEALRRAL